MMIQSDSFDVAQRGSSAHHRGARRSPFIALLVAALCACSGNGSPSTPSTTGPADAGDVGTTDASDSSLADASDVGATDAADTAPADAVDASSTTAAAVSATKWGKNVTITLTDGHFRFQSDGRPNHALEAEYIMPDDGSSCVPHPTADCSHIEPASTAILAGTLDHTITTTPQKVAETTTVPVGPMGILISGSQVYNPFEGDGTTIAMSANFTLTDSAGKVVAFMDSCNGHPSPHPLDRYHYHGLPMCVTSQVDLPSGPSHVIGYAFDGFPIYGDRDIGGNQIDPTTLDECNGIESPTPEFPAGIYHYVLLEVPTVQSTIRCLHGKLDGPLPGIF